MTVGGALAQRYYGVPLALWLLAGGVGFYMLMHHQQHGTWGPSVSLGGSRPIFTGQLIGGQTPGWAGAPPGSPIYMPVFPEPVVSFGPEHEEGARY